MGPLQIVLPGLGCGTNLAARSMNSAGTERSLHGRPEAIQRGGPHYKVDRYHYYFTVITHRNSRYDHRYRRRLFS